MPVKATTAARSPDPPVPAVCVNASPLRRRRAAAPLAHALPAAAPMAACGSSTARTRQESKCKKLSKIASWQIILFCVIFGFYFFLKWSCASFGHELDLYCVGLRAAHLGQIHSLNTALLQEDCMDLGVVYIMDLLATYWKRNQSFNIFHSFHLF